MWDGTGAWEPKEKGVGMVFASNDNEQIVERRAMPPILNIFNL